MDNIENKKRILIIDDSKTQLGFFKIHFTNAGYEVITSSFVDDAFIKIFEYQPDIILSDVVMDNASGFQLCKMLKKHIVLKHIPIILFTSSMDIISNSFWAEKAKADRFISKNSNIGEIIELVNELSSEITVSQDIKNQLMDNKDKAGILFLENKRVSDKEWMNDVIMKEFRHLTKYIDSPKELMTKLFAMLSSIMRYNLCFVLFNKRNHDKLDLYANVNYDNICNDTLDKLANDFIQQIFKEDKKINITINNTNIISTKEIHAISSYKNHKIIPIADEDQIYGAIGFYYSPNNSTPAVSYFDDIVFELSSLIQNKIYSETINFLSYNNNDIGLYNRFQFIDNLSVELARTKLNNSSVSVVMFTFNNYDEINSKYGVDVANFSIKKAVQLVTSSLRFPDKVYRYNHQTLLMILANADTKHAVIPIKRITKQLNEYKISFNEDEFVLSTTAAVIDNHTQHENAEDLFDTVQKILKNIKSENDNGIVVYHETIN